MDIELLSLDRLPLPSLEMYAFLSVVAASSSIYYFWMESQSATFSLFKTNYSQISDDDDSSSHNALSQVQNATANTHSVNQTLLSNQDTSFSWHNAIHWASQQPHCVWPLVNLAYCLLIVLAHHIQKCVFGNLRASEQENIKDQFWNLVFYKVVFVFGVVKVESVEDAVGWCFFVFVIGFLQLARELCKDRHNYLIIMNDWTHDGDTRRNRISGLLSFILCISLGLFSAVCIWYSKSSYKVEFEILEWPGSPTSRPSVQLSPSGSYDFNLGIHSALFMLCEIGLLVIQAFHALLVCVMDHIHSKLRRRHNSSDSDDSSTRIVHAINFRMDLTALMFDLVHHVHMLICCNLFLSMTSLIVSLQMRARVRQIHSILKKQQCYVWLTQHINKYPEYTVRPDSEQEDCAICWDAMYCKKSKVLPCSHIFHAACLRKWLLVSMNCPTCRMSLISETDLQKSPRGRRRHHNIVAPVGVWGFLQTGQTLLDLFGGWDPEHDEMVVVEEPSSSANVSLFGDFGVQDWTVQGQTTRTEAVPPTEDEKSG